jgi:hypothetical protein
MGQLIKVLSKSIKLNGFKKENLIWRKIDNNFTYIIDLQSDKYNRKDDESFTFNIAIFSDKVYQMTWLKDAPEKPKDTDSAFRKRISYFLEHKGDKWWSLRSEENVKEILPEVIGILNTLVLPFFERINNYSELYNIMRDLDDQDSRYPLFQIQVACLSILIGHKSNGVAILENVKKNPVWGENAARILENSFLDLHR